MVAKQDKKCMNYLDAHRIVNEYIAQIANKPKGEPFLVQDFNFTIEELAVAFKLHLAIMNRYGIRIYTEEEMKGLVNSLKLLYSIPWVDNSFAKEYRECQTILEDNGILARFLNREKIILAKEKMSRLKREIQSRIPDMYEWLSNVATFMDFLCDECERSVKSAKEIPQGLKNRTQVELEIATAYCINIYNYLGMEPQVEEIRLFWPLPMLYNIMHSYPWVECLSEEQKKYITKNQRG